MLAIESLVVAENKVAHTCVSAIFNVRHCTTHVLSVARRMPELLLMLRDEITTTNVHTNKCTVAAKNA